ncbi:hypothetical protein HC256_001400 [Beauveria bassiana]|nr:hypothetical protein HC256_001400 [Beauveria bassiana]
MPHMKHHLRVQLEWDTRLLKNGMEVMTLFLERRGDEIIITDKVIEAATGNEESAMEVMALLLEQRGSEIEITDGASACAIKNGCSWDTSNGLDPYIRSSWRNAQREALIQATKVWKAHTHTSTIWGLHGYVV